MLLAASQSSFDTVWFIKVRDINCKGGKTYDYGNKFIDGIEYNQIVFWKKSQSQKQNNCSTRYELQNVHYTESLHYVEQNNFTRLIKATLVHFSY